jgi:hypothetical protein
MCRFGSRKIKRLWGSPFLYINTPQTSGAAVARSQHAGGGGARLCLSRRPRPRDRHLGQVLEEQAFRMDFHGLPIVALTKEQNCQQTEGSFRKGTEMPHHGYGPHSQANGVSKRETTFRLPNHPTRRFPRPCASVGKIATQRPGRSITWLPHEGPPYNFFVPPGRGIPDRALGPWPKKLGRWAAAA